MYEVNNLRQGGVGGWNWSVSPLLPSHNHVTHIMTWDNGPGRPIYFWPGWCVAAACFHYYYYFFLFFLRGVGSPRDCRPFWIPPEMPHRPFRGWRKVNQGPLLMRTAADNAISASSPYLESGWDLLAGDWREVNHNRVRVHSFGCSQHAWRLLRLWEHLRSWCTRATKYVPQVCRLIILSENQSLATRRITVWVSV